jgi:hypothetical protein
MWRNIITLSTTLPLFNFSTRIVRKEQEFEAGNVGIVAVRVKVEYVTSSASLAFAHLNAVQCSRKIRCWSNPSLMMMPNVYSSNSPISVLPVTVLSVLGYPLESTSPKCGICLDKTEYIGRFHIHWGRAVMASDSSLVAFRLPFLCVL